MKKWLGMVFATILVCACFTSCDTGPESGDRSNNNHNNPDDITSSPLVLDSMDEIREHLNGSQNGSSPDDPVKLTVKISASEWEQLFDAVRLADNFVAFDLSQCYNTPQDFTFGMKNYGDKIVRLILPVGIKFILNSAFSECMNLKQITLPEGLAQIGNYSFDGCTSLVQITLPASLTQIRTAAFRSCTNLEQIDLPANLTRLDTQIFDGCTILTLVICRPVTPPSYYFSNIFSGTSPNLVIQVPSGSVAAYKAAWSEYADKITSY